MQRLFSPAPPLRPAPSPRRLRRGRALCAAAADGKQEKNFMERLGVSTGPIALSLGPSQQSQDAPSAAAVSSGPAAPAVRLNSLTTEEWKDRFVKEGTVDLWLEDDFNAPSRLPAGVPYGRSENVAWSGVASADAKSAVHRVEIRARDGGPPLAVKSAADRYVLFEAEEQGLELPNACRQGACTACAVRLVSGAPLAQPQALGLSAGLRREGYALLCVAYARGDCCVELQDPDEVYELQFGEAFARLATDKNAASILRDDLALEIAAGDE